MGPALEYVDRAVAWAEENSELGHVPFRAFSKGRRCCVQS